MYRFSGDTLRPSFASMNINKYIYNNMNAQQQLDFDHLREKQKGMTHSLIKGLLELQEKEKAWEEQKELQRQLKNDIDDKQKQVQMLNNEIKTKQVVLKRMSTPHPVKDGPNIQQSLQDEIELRDKQIEVLNDRVLVQDHELRELRNLKNSLDQLKKLEKELDKKDSVISEMKKKVMIQEEAIGQWIEAMDEKKKQITDKDKQIVTLKAEVDSIAERFHSQIEGLEV